MISWRVGKHLNTAAAPAAPQSAQQQRGAAVPCPLRPLGSLSPGREGIEKRKHIEEESIRGRRERVRERREVSSLFNPP